MILETSKRPFRHPVPVEAIGHFCHPWEKHHYHLPAWGREGKLYASNGFLAVRFFNFTPAEGPGPMAVVDRLMKLPWHSGKFEDAKAWRKLDDVTLDLFREGLFPVWPPTRRAYTVDPCARINHGALVPLVSLQLISRLPRCEIYTTIDRGAPVAFRFNGGEGLIAQLTAGQEAVRTDTVCHIFARADSNY